MSAPTSGSASDQSARTAPSTPPWPVNQWYVAAYASEITHELFARTVCGEFEMDELETKSQLHSAATNKTGECEEATHARSSQFSSSFLPSGDSPAWRRNVSRLVDMQEHFL